MQDKIIKFKIPYELLKTYSKNDLNPMSKIGYCLKSFLNLEGDEKIDVSKLWVNVNTDNTLENYFINYLQKQGKGKKESKSNIGWYKLQLFPACDLNNIKNLEDNYIYVMPDFKIKDKK